MHLVQLLLIALMQGLTELFPVSSLGHAVVLPAVLHWTVDEHAPDFLPILVMLHVGTLSALLLYFRHEWIGIARGVLRGHREGDPENYRHLAGLLVVGTLPAVALGFFLEKQLRQLFGEPVVAAAFLVVNGGMLLLGERLRRRTQNSGTSESATLQALTWRQALGIGLWQCIAFIPGMSRSGATMVGGLRAGLDHLQAARFSFLLSAPVIAGAAVLELPRLGHGGTHGQLSALLLAGVVAGVAAYSSTAFLMRYFRHHETSALHPFAWYCATVGAGALLLLRC
ncbi:MAG: undecaprenyl-diphosphate phosphatase [Xanthomonadaceae bacterium]|jgi:undecaprenyl-diphosphatase|nr:undecaprenyl-diphosphate phosphatase [Xanthomonadaceae bacterium]MDE3073369.1 undecaprenyl-diphosphate phosphatase [Pseudomonadota bacterium]